MENCGSLRIGKSIDVSKNVFDLGHGYVPYIIGGKHNFVPRVILNAQWFATCDKQSRCIQRQQE